MSAPNVILDISQLGKTYPSPQGPAVIVRDFNLKVAEGEYICIVGHSGCGKSTVLSIVMGLNEATQGAVVLSGHEIHGPGVDRGVVFQTPSLFPWLSALQNVALSVSQSDSKLSRAEKKARALKYLDLVGLADIADHYPDSLSAGMRQRVGIARALALEPEVLLLDEPFSLLDALTRMELQDLVLHIWETQKKTILMVTHDVDEALLLADRVVMMTSGPAATVGEVLTVPFERPRSRAALLDRPDYYQLRDRVIRFLEEQGHPTTAAEEPDPETVHSPYEVEGFEGPVIMVPMVDIE